MDIVEQLRYAGDHALFEPHLHHSAADEIVRLQEALKYIAMLQPWESQSKFIIEYAIDKLKEKE